MISHFALISRRGLVRVVAASAFAFASVAVAASPSSAMRHLKLLKSFPAADTTLSKSPDAVRLWLTEPAELPASKISVATEAGAVVATTALTRAAAKDAPVEAKFVKPLAGGSYKVTWKTMSKDGHVVNGTFGFKVRTPK